MKKINRKKLATIMFILVIIIIEIWVFGLSRANKRKEIKVYIIDNDNLISNEESFLHAIDDGESGYYIDLPEILNDKFISKYIITSKSQITDYDTTQTEELLEKKPGGRIYLTQEELESGQITLNVVYDTKYVDDHLLYKRQITQKVKNNQIIIQQSTDDKELKEISIKGYIPIEANIYLEDIDIVKIENMSIEKIDINSTVNQAYSLKLMVNELEYNCKDYREKLEICISGIDTTKNNFAVTLTKNEENEYLEIKKILDANISDKAIFIVEELNTYAIIETTTTLNSLEQVQNELLSDFSSVKSDAIINTNLAWDGTVSTGFINGEGTEENPYLISTGQELAYLAQQVNNGQSYEGKYFQLTNDINLNGRQWIQIGNHTSTFKGIFNGAGHIIYNATLLVPNTIPNNTTYSYGFFGTIGDGNNCTEIKNIEFNSINILIELNGQTTTNTTTQKGIHVGVVAGTMYNKSKISNVIVKNTTIQDTGTFMIRSRIFEMFIGGLVGSVQNTSTSKVDPGVENRYAIENCYIHTNIDLSITTSNTRYYYYLTQYHVGGIVGSIRNQPVWPDNCLYEGTINATGFVGPIFGGLIGNESIPSSNTVNNFSTYWNGNQLGNLTMTSYYTNYTVNGTSFTQTVTSGISTAYINSTISNTNISGVKGVNKGIYVEDVSQLLDILNSYIGNKGVIWEYLREQLNLIPRLSATVEENEEYNYEIILTDSYQKTPYKYSWYINDVLDNSINATTATIVPTFDYDIHVKVLIEDADGYYSIVSFTIPKLYIKIAFNINTNNDTVTASLEGTALSYINVLDYTFKWYKEDISGEGGIVEGATNLTLDNLEKGFDYKLVANNNNIQLLSAENSFTYGDRKVVYLNYSTGNDSNDGATPETPVRLMSRAYALLNSAYTRNENVIVIMGNYTNNSYFNSETATTYSKDATITGKYRGIDYNGTLYFEGESSYKYLTANTTFQYLEFRGATSTYEWNYGQVYFYLQGYSLTMGEGLTMTRYSTANTNQGLIIGNAPGFHLIAGWLQYDYATLPRNNPKIVVKSGTYGRIILGGSPGTNAVSNLQQYTSRNFTGSSVVDTFKVTIDVKIKNSTTPNNYAYDINLLVGGPACGNTYANITENIISGKIGRVLGGSIGDTSNRPSNWYYPINTFIGETTINVFGGTITELYGGCLGRNMSALSGSSSLICDSYFYGDININITGGHVLGNIYGAGAGGVTGYHIDSSDQYKIYGESIDTSVNINISGGIIDGNTYGGGYGYTEYLIERVTAQDGGALYGNSYINISGAPIINGNIYAAGCGYNLSSRPELAKMIGNSNITIQGSANINGLIFGAGAGIVGYDNMAKLIGSSNINIFSDLKSDVYGGGNIAQTDGQTNININNGNHTANIYGGGNIGVVNGTANIKINGGTSNRIYGGGNQASTTTTNVNIKSGYTNNVFGGGNQAGVTNSSIYLEGGTVENIYGGSNVSGIVNNSNIISSSCIATNIYGGNNEGGNVNQSNINITGGSIESLYGGGNKADVTISNVNINEGNAEIVNIYGGGNNASVTTTNINIRGGTISGSVFGGSNIIGNVNNSNIIVEDATLNNIYGGNNLGGTTIESLIKIKGGTIDNIYGGGNQALSTVSNIYVESGNTKNIYGGGNQAGLNTSNIQLIGGNVSNVYGGSNQSGDVETTNITTLGAGLDGMPGVIMNVTYSANNITWESNTYETVVDVFVTITNTTDTNINAWSGSISTPDSTLFSNYSNTNVNQENGIYTFNNVNQYGGTNELSPRGGSYSFSFQLLSNISASEFDLQYSFTGTGENGNIYADANGTYLNINNIYGGNNKGGIAEFPNVNISGGGIGNVYGGGNRAEVPNTNVIINNGIINNVYGGGNAAAVMQNSNLKVFRRYNKNKYIWRRR